MRLASVPLAGHPDRVCDLVAAGIVDEYLRRDPETRIKCNVSGGRGAIFVTGEILTSADFDVSHLVQRILGKLGVYEAMEPFIALEPVVSEQVGQWRQACTEPTLVTGYATAETDSLMPAPMHLAKKLALMLDEKRKNDPDWFWLGTAGTVSVLGEGKRLTQAIAEVDHGTQPIEKVRQAITREFDELGLDQKPKLQINLLGPSDKQGIEAKVGVSQSNVLAYGQGLPAIVNPAGHDWHGAEVQGVWLARYWARKILKETKAQAVMTELLYLPGDDFPSIMVARDERGNDLSKTITLSREEIKDLLAAWVKPGIMTEAVEANLIGDPHLPWEA